MHKRYCKGLVCATTFTTRRRGPAATQRRRELQRTAEKLQRTTSNAEKTDTIQKQQHPIVHSLSIPVFWIAAGICVIAEIAILRAAFTPGGSTSESSPMPHSPRGAEMIWAVIPAIVLALLLAATWRAVQHH
jgi:heme/copper-type cytochrome/quinol oxidase subunit 2